LVDPRWGVPALLSSLLLLENRTLTLIDYSEFAHGYLECFRKMSEAGRYKVLFMYHLA
jgi:hypothetical protein